MNTSKSSIFPYLKRIFKIDEPLNFLREGHPQESAILILFIILVLTLLSAAYVLELLRAIIVWWGHTYNEGMIFSLIRLIAQTTILFFAVITYFFSEKIFFYRQDLLSIEKDHKLQRMVNDCTKLAGIRTTPKVLVNKSQRSQIITFGRSTKKVKIIFSEDIIENLEENETRAIILHELGHINNGDVGLVTWGNAFSEAIKYYVLINFFVLLIELVFYFGVGIDQLIRYILFGGDLPSVGNSFIITMLLFYFFVKITVNYAFKSRELAADDFALKYIKPKFIINAIKTIIFSVLVNIEKNDSKKKKFNIVLKSKFNNIRNLLMRRHPTISNRILRIKNNFNYKNKPIVPSFTASIYFGITTGLLFIVFRMIGLSIWGLLGELQIVNVDPSIFSSLSAWLSVFFFVIWTPIIFYLNTKSKKKFWITRKEKLYTINGLTEYLTINIIFATIAFFIILFVDGFPVLFQNIMLYSTLNRAFEVYLSFLTINVDYSISALLLSLMVTFFTLLLCALIQKRRLKNIAANSKLL